MLELIFVSTLLIGLILYAYFEKHPNGYPPGPWGFPILGHLPIMTADPHLKFMEWKKIYGPVFSVRFGSMNSVVINDYKILKEVFSKPEFSGRPKLPSFADRCGGIPRGILFTEGEEWKEQRKFSRQQLRDFGFGTKSMKDYVEKAIAETIQIINESAGKPCDPKHWFSWAATNIVMRIVAGDDFEKTDAGLMEVFMRITKNLEDFNLLREITHFLPWVPKYFPRISGYEETNRDRDFILAYVGNFLKKHMQSYEPGKPRSFLDTYADKINETTDVNSSFHKSVGESSMMNTLLDFFLAGSETTSTTMHWAISLLIRNPEVQLKLQEEIDAVIGCDRDPDIEDEPNMVYTQAVICEINRIASLLPFAMFHNTHTAATIGPYKVPKDTMIVANLYAIHYDPDVWQDPKEFRPERFLSADGKTLVKNEALIPFCTGKRICFGEPLAKMEIFYFLTNVFQKFNVIADPENPYLDEKPSTSFVLLLKRYKAVFQRRPEWRHSVG